jgi:uncharacterized protein
MKHSMALFWILLTAFAQAASFDCAKASTKVETMICGDAELSKLDEDLNTAYLSAMQDGSLTKAARRDQKEWLKVRNGCADKKCVKDIYESRIAQLTLGENVRITKGMDNPICVKVKNGYVPHIDYNLMHALRPDSTARQSYEVRQSYEEGLARADIDNNGHLENVVRVHGYRGSYETSYLATTDDSRTRILETPLNKTLQGIEANDLFILDGVTYIGLEGGYVHTIYKIEHENADLVCELQRYTSFSEGR